MELGLPIDSADCYWYKHGREVIPDTHTYSSWNCNTMNDVIFPCWSFGRLLDIINKTQDRTNVFNFRGVDNYIDWAIRYIEQSIYLFDFSKWRKMI